MSLPNEAPVTAVFDKGRRGNPLQGCDCVQCFGYCMVDPDEADRLRAPDPVIAADLGELK